MANLSKLQWIVVGVVALIVIVVLDVLIGTTVTPRLIATPTPTHTKPASCQEIRDADPTAPDGGYLIKPDDLPFTVYCHDMAGTPKEYLTLLYTGGESNFSQYPVGGATTTTETVTTHYNKIRLDPSNLTVDIADHTFATSTGQINLSGPPYSFDWRPYAYASDCRYWPNAPNGQANIDLTGTPFIVSDTFSTFGWQAGGSATYSADSHQVVKLVGGGHCGGFTADPVHPDGNWIWKPVGPWFSLNLKYAVIYVDHQAAGTNHGSSWADAYTDLLVALAAAVPGQEIWVAGGTYKPTSGIDRSATFDLKKGVALYGGFAGNETSRDQRDWKHNITILSGDIDGNDITENGVITTTAYITGENSYHVVTGSGTDHTAILDGFTITGGQANGAYSGPCGPACGGGMFNNNSSPTLANVAFSGNFAAQAGGGMYNHEYSSPSLTNVTFSGNTARVYGGGMFNGTESNSQLTDVTFSGNTADDSGGGMHNFTSSPVLTATQFLSNTAPLGGGIFNNQSSPTLTNTNFIGNTAKRNGGGMYNTGSSPSLTNVTFSGNQADGFVTNQGGGGMFNDGGRPKLVHVKFERNNAQVWGGGMYNVKGSPRLTSTTFISNTADAGGGIFSEGGQPVLVNVVFWKNEARINGGGLHTYTSDTPKLINVTFSENDAKASGGGMYNIDSNPSLTNCILWDNNAPNGPQIYNESNSAPNISYSLVQGGYSGTGNLDVDPLFVDPASGDLHLKPGSPAIDKGNTEEIRKSGVTTDLDGKPRVVCDVVDMGAYEYQTEGCSLK
jgi:hypothetical protein